jgi:hypothetical protein
MRISEFYRSASIVVRGLSKPAILLQVTSCLSHSDPQTSSPKSSDLTLEQNGFGNSRPQLNYFDTDIGPTF